MQTIYKKGFTLIELLVVIAIIGILAGIVLASLSTARSGANDAKSKEQLSGFRTAMESYYSTNNNYGPAATAADGCTATPSLAPYSTLALADEDNYPNGSTLVCWDNRTASAAATAWGAAIRLGGGATTDSFFCVDSTGAATTTGSTAPIASGDVAC